MSNRAGVLVLLTVCLMAISGCAVFDFLGYMVAPQGETKVTAEYGGLAKGEHLLVLVYADEATLFEYPFARYEVAEFVAEELREKLSVEILDNQQVARFQEQTLDWEAMPLSQIGARFGADVVLYLELLEFTTREHGSQNLYRGRIRAAGTMVRLNSADVPMRVWQNEVLAIYPEAAPVSSLSTTDQNIRGMALRRFAKSLGQRFYDHTKTM